MSKIPQFVWDALAQIAGDLIKIVGHVVARRVQALFAAAAVSNPELQEPEVRELVDDIAENARIVVSEVVRMPIGDVFTMGPEDAARACSWVGVRQVVPIHHGTFPVLTGTPDDLRRHVAHLGIEVLELTPGQTAD